MIRRPIGWVGGCVLQGGWVWCVISVGLEGTVHFHSLLSVVQLHKAGVTEEGEAAIATGKFVLHSHPGGVLAAHTTHLLLHQGLVVVRESRVVLDKRRVVLRIEQSKVLEEEYSESKPAELILKTLHLHCITVDPH